MRMRKTREKNSDSYVGVVYRSAKNYSHWQENDLVWIRQMSTTKYTVTSIFLSRTCFSQSFFRPTHCVAQRKRRKNWNSDKMHQPRLNVKKQKRHHVHVDWHFGCCIRLDHRVLLTLNIYIFTSQLYLRDYIYACKLKLYV